MESCSDIGMWENSGFGDIDYLEKNTDGQMVNPSLFRMTGYDATVESSGGKINKDI